MANDIDLLPDGDLVENEQTEDPEDSDEYDPYIVRMAEENQRSHCDKFALRYCMGVAVFLYICTIGMACFFLYLGRFALFRGFAVVERTYNSTDLTNLGGLITGRNIIYKD